MRALLAGAALIQLDRLRGVLETLAALLMRLDRHHREIVLDNLRIAFPDWSDERRAQVARRAFANWGRIAAELVHADAFLSSPLQPVVADLRARIDELTAGGTGVLILGAHTANFELLARLFGEAGREVTVFHRQMTNRLVNDHLVAQRRRAHLNSLGRGASIREALRVLAARGTLVVPLDQNQPLRRGIFVEMFGRPACTSTLLARLSLASGAPVLPVFAVWEGDGLTAMVGEVIQPPVNVAAQDRGQAIAALTARYTSEIERAVRAHPEQWNWAHRRWKTRPRSDPLRPE